MATKRLRGKRLRDDLTAAEIIQALIEIESKYLDYIKLIYPHPTFKPTALWKDLFDSHESMSELVHNGYDLAERLWDLCDLHIDSSSMKHCPRCKGELNGSHKCPNGHVWHDDFNSARCVLCTDACPFCRFHQFLDYDTCRLNRCWSDCAFDCNNDGIRIDQDRYEKLGLTPPDWMKKMWV